MRVHQEYQYLDLVENILICGEDRVDRTGTGTISLFAPPHMRFDLSIEFPLLTTKAMYLRPIFEELMWFIRGQTNAKELQKKNVNIWNQNGTREFLDSRGLSYKVGDLGPIYGFQWRHFGADYIDSETDYDGKGIDQLYNVIKALLFDPTSRRIILTAWNPSVLDRMALPPCHVLCQFYVSGQREHRTLNCQLYQRSCDMGLGVPFNIASYALLTKMLAHVCGYHAGDLVHCLGDAHIYVNHIDQLKQQIMRVPKKFPKLQINKGTPGDARVYMSHLDQLKNQVEKVPEKFKMKDIVNYNEEVVVSYAIKTLELFQFQDLELVGYESHEHLKMKMSV